MGCIVRIQEIDEKMRAQYSAQSPTHTTRHIDVFPPAQESINASHAMPFQEYSADAEVSFIHPFVCVRRT